MVTTVFFTTDQIQVLQGKIVKDLLQVQKLYTEKLEPGTMINGVITNEAALFRGMESILSKVKLQKENLDLIVDSGSVLTKRLDVPILPNKNLRRIAEEEFLSVTEHHMDLIYDYGVLNPLNPTGGGVILCAAMERSLVFNYIDVFKRLKLHLSTIDLAISCETRLVQYLPELSEKTFILVTLDGSIMSMSLYVKGQFLFSNRARFSVSIDSEEAIGEVQQNINSLMQFNSAQRTGEGVSHVFFCGTKDEEKMQKLSERLAIPVSTVHNSPAVRVSSEISGFNLSDYFHSVGNLLIKDGAYHG